MSKWMWIGTIILIIVMLIWIGLMVWDFIRPIEDNFDLVLMPAGKLENEANINDLFDSTANNTEMDRLNEQIQTIEDIKKFFENG